MRYALLVSLALLALPVLAAAQQSPAPPESAMQAMPMHHAVAMPAAQQRPPLDPTSFCYFADRAYSLGAHMTDQVCSVSDRSMMVYQDGKEKKPLLAWKKAEQ